MVTRRSLVLGGACAAVGSAALAGAVFALSGRVGPAQLPSLLASVADANAFAGPIYDDYMGRDAKGVSLDDELTIRRYFEPALATAMAKDQEAARAGDVGKLAFDPFVETKDWKIYTLDVTINASTFGKAQATVKFSNQGEAMTVVLDLVQVENDWRIYDITWNGKTETLRSIFVGKPGWWTVFSS
jgi:hypothetical protein